ncbi:MAG: hypothetical protein ACJ8NS_04740 [Chthoniobacterales bacterium]|jgi:hypothetical protein
MSAIAVFKRWPIACWLFCLHALLILGVYILWLASSRDVERDMIWLFARLFDFPVSPLEDIVNPRYGFPAAITCILIGGALWALVGLILDLVRRSLMRGASLRGSRNI